MKDIENDLLEVQTLRTNPYSKMLTRLQGKDAPEPIRRVFLTGANPFILKTEKLLEISTLIKKYLPSVTSIGCFARITDSVNKTDDDLMLLRNAGYNGLTIGVETGDDKKHLLNTLDKIISEVSEEDLRHYRKNLRHL